MQKGAKLTILVITSNYVRRSHLSVGVKSQHFKQTGSKTHGFSTYNE